MKTTARPGRVSLWQAQLGALGLDAAAAATPAAQAEAACLQRLRLPPLVLPERTAAAGRVRWSWRAWALPLVGAMAVAAFAVLRQRQRGVPDGDSLHMKGAGSVAVYFEREGRVRALGDGGVGALIAGDRVRAEIQAAADGVAFWAVTDLHGRLLVSQEFVAASALPLTAGGRAAFVQSLRLVGTAVGETLVVIVCAHPQEASGLSAAMPQDSRILAAERLPPGCQATVFALR